MSSTDSSSRFPVIGLGASAGGLSALEKFFANVPADSGMAFVVVTHQQPGRQSLLPELLAKVAKIPIMAAAPHMAVTVNCAYVAPAGACLSIRNEQLQLDPILPGDPRLPIDHFFRSLAQNEHEQAIAIVLSGTGSDGSIGIADIKAASGLVIAQDPQTAQYPGMPQSAIETKIVDYVLAPENMAERLQQYVRSRYTLPAEELRGDPGDSDGAVFKILSVLRSRTSHDFTAYKKSTIRRRIQRRMNVHGIDNPRDYAQYLEQTPYEVDALFKELLISVTSFFRDPDAYAALEPYLNKLIESKREDASIRGWIAGCATGEEAYSLAIIISEMVQKLSRNLKIQLFATDLDPHAIDVARAGNYPEGIAADIPAERLGRFFTRSESAYRINKDVRDMIVFATQNLTRDPPFTRLDLVTCRNLLIYLEPELQRRVCNLFAYSLRPSGLLLLGTSESLTGFEDRFTTLDKRWKLFQRREQGVGALLPDLGASMSANPPVQRTPVRAGMRPSTVQLIERVLLSAFAPPTAVISQRGEIIYIHGRTGPFLEPAAGEPSNNILNMAREGLRLELPSAIRQASVQEEPAVRQGLRVKTNGGFSSVRLSVRKLVEFEQLRGTFMVSFESELPAVTLPEGEPRAEDHVSDLENELQRTRENLQGTIEELESSNEELKSTNEELQSTNEELQSANEELETSREEMQSLNEELQIVNVELAQRNRALSETNDDMHNLLNSTDVATLFLDEKLNIKRFTTQAKKVFSLIDTDVGRPISDLAANLRHDRLLDDAREVLRSLAFHEQEIQTKDGAWRWMRIMPYRTHDNLIDGLVLTFIDIDRMKRSEREQQEGRLQAESIIDALPTPLVVLDAALTVVSANRAFLDRFRTTAKLVVGEPFRNIVDEMASDVPALPRLQAILAGGGTRERVRLAGAFSRIGKAEFMVTAYPLQSPEARPKLLLAMDETQAGS